MEAYEQNRRRKMMTKARLIKKQEIEEREAQKDLESTEVSTEVNKSVKQRLGAMVEWPGSTKRQDPRKAFADLFAQP
jgi:hypothetical protein